MLSFSHVSVKIKTQQSLVSCCVDRLSWIKSSLFSRERTFENMSDGIAGLVGLALSLPRIPPCLPCFCPLPHRRRRRFVRVASVDEAAVSGFGFTFHILGCVQKPSLKTVQTQDTIKPSPLLLLSSLYAFFEPHSSVFQPASQLLTPRWEGKPTSLLSFFLSFFLSFIFFYFPLRVSCYRFKFCCHALSHSSTRVCDRLKTSTSHNSTSSASAQPLFPKTSLQWVLKFQPISNLVKPPFCKEMTKGNPLTHRQCKKVTSRFLAELVYLIDILTSLRNSIQGLNRWLMVVQVYAIAHIAINLGFHVFILLNSSFPQFLSFCNFCECVNACVHVLD